MQEELSVAIECIRGLRRANKYEGERIGKLSTVENMAPMFTYRVGDVVLFKAEGHGVTISRPWRAVERQRSPGLTETVGTETIANLPPQYVEEYDYSRIPKGLYEPSHGVGQTVLQGVDALAVNGHREAAFLLLLNVISGLSRRRYPVPETPEGLPDHRELRRKISSGAAKSDKDAFVTFVDEELLALQDAHPEHCFGFDSPRFCTMDSSCSSVGEWIYSYFRCMLVHGTKTSSAYQLDMSSDSLASEYQNIDKGTRTRSIAFGFHLVLRQIVANAKENDESF